MEDWKPIPGTDSLYSVSNLGRVRSEPVPGRTGRQRGRVLTPCEDNKGYLIFRICLLSGVKWQTRVHRVVAAVFLGECPEGMQVNHKNGDKKDNRPENLEYVSCAENIRHAWANGLHDAEHCTGEKNNKSKLTAEDVKTIRRLSNEMTLQAIAELYGVTKQAIWHIVKFKTWKHVPTVEV